ncbi:cytochrome c [Mesorhizobium sp. M0983]|uniref:c-type cytochrome n=1 Tax=Mesorhizobium sp. M0983 TaxID=2957040 RepID=UPI0033367FBE
MNRITSFAAAAAVAALAAFPVFGQSSDSTGFGDASKIQARDGAGIYAAICRGCHMPQAVGAVGAGNYPALAKNEKLEGGAYPVFMVVNGQRAMPPLGSYLDDEQVAAVVNYIRTNLGNNYTDAVTVKDVQAARP